MIWQLSLNTNIALEVVMLVRADALLLDRERADEPKSQQALAPSVQDVSESEKTEIGREGLPSYDHRGTIVVAGVWLAFYVIAAIHHFISIGN
jgi:hypothetical protein